MQSNFSYKGKISVVFIYKIIKYATTITKLSFLLD